jgi:hypothetical protein
MLGLPRNKQFVLPHLSSCGRAVNTLPTSLPLSSDLRQRLVLMSFFLSLSLSLSGRILDLKTGTVKKEGQQSSMRMCMGSRRSFICRMRSVGTSGGPCYGGCTSLTPFRAWADSAKVTGADLVSL